MLRNHSEMQCIMTEVTNNGIKPVTNIGIHITSNRVLFRLLSSSKDNQMAIRILTKYINTTTYIYRSKKQHKARVRDNCLCELCTGTATQNTNQPRSSKYLRDMLADAEKTQLGSRATSPTTSRSAGRGAHTPRGSPRHVGPTTPRSTGRRHTPRGSDRGSYRSYGSTRSPATSVRTGDDQHSDRQDDEPRSSSNSTTSVASTSSWRSAYSRKKSERAYSKCIHDLRAEDCRELDVEDGKKCTIFCDENQCTCVIFD